MEFEINNFAPLLFGPMSKFQIQGHFETRATDNDEWDGPAAADASNVLLAPNWFEMLIKSVDVFHNNQRISASDEARFIPAHLNAMLYAYMEPTAKKLLSQSRVKRSSSSSSTSSKRKRSVKQRQRKYNRNR